MKAWLKGLFNSAPSPVSKSSADAALRRKVLDEDIPRYPPFMKGLPALTPDKLVESQFELVRQIQSSVMVSRENYEKHYLGAIRRFAAFAHLLPASQSHHHRGAGGLLRHSLECGLMALQGSDKMLLDLGKPPSHRRELEPRVQLAAFLGGLCHDAGKPATDLVVTSHDREKIWKPIKENLWDWTQSTGVESYFLEWRTGRNKQHQALSNLLADRIITTETLAWIAEGGTELVVWLMESLNENPTAANPMYELVKRADQQSVKRDLETMGAAMAGYEVGVPVERSITDAMRNLVRQGIWSVNEPGARVWNIGGHIYLVWPAAGQELAQVIRDEGVPGIPRTCDSILDMLVERQLAFLPEGHDAPDRLWRIAPDVITAKIPGKELSCIRLRNDSLISTIPIAKVPGVVLGLAGAATAQDAATSSTPTTPTTQPASKPQPVEESASDTEKQAQPEFQLQSQSQPQGQKPARSVPTLATAAEPSPSASGASYPIDLETGEIYMPEAPVEPKVQVPPPAEVSTTAPLPAKPKEKARRSDPPTVRFDGAAGEGIKALIDDLNCGTRKWGVDVRVDADEHVLITWPSAFSGYGLTGKVLLEEMSVNEWLWVDDDNPLRKLQDFEVNKGEFIKVLRLDSEASYAFLHAAKPHVSKQHVSKQEEAPAPVTPPAPVPCPVTAVTEGPRGDNAKPPHQPKPAKPAEPAEGASKPSRGSSAPDTMPDVEAPPRGGGQLKTKNNAHKDRPNRSMPSRVPVPPAGHEPPAPPPASEQTSAQEKMARQLEHRMESETPPARKRAVKKGSVTIDQVLSALEGGGLPSALRPGWMEYLVQDGRSRLKEGGADVERSELFALCKEHSDRLGFAKGLIMYKPKGEKQG